MRKVIIINTADEGGGSDRVSMLTLNGLLERGIDAWLLVGEKKTDHERVLPFYLSPFFDYRPFAARIPGMMRQLRKRAIAKIGIDDFEFPYSHHMELLTGSPPDLVLCHNLHGGFFDLRALAPLSRRIPIAMRLFSTWIFTGHCALTNGCENWKNGCGSCPDLTLPPAIPHDFTRYNLARKQRILADVRLHCSAESDWLVERVRHHSVLAPLVSDWRVIRSGVDLTVYRPGSKAQARSALGLPMDRTIVLYVANGGARNPFKDFATVRQALASLENRPDKPPIDVLIAGASGPAEQVTERITIRPYGYVRSPERMTGLMRAADLYVHASREELYGLSVCEALACGAPTILASAGGVLENVRDQETALVVPVGNSAALAAAVQKFIDDPDFAAAVGRNAAEDGRRRMDQRTMIDEVHEWCSEIHARFTRKRVRQGG